MDVVFRILYSIFQYVILFLHKGIQNLEDKYEFDIKEVCTMKDV